MKIKTSELTGAALDWAVAIVVYGGEKHIPAGFPAYSESWAQGGPIIERERILIQPEIGKEGCANAWNAISIRNTEAYGPTPLIAAMRCYVAAKWNHEVEIPEELK